MDFHFPLHAKSVMLMEQDLFGFRMESGSGQVLVGIWCVPDLGRLAVRAGAVLRQPDNNRELASIHWPVSALGSPAHGFYNSQKERIV